MPPAGPLSPIRLKSTKDKNKGAGLGLSMVQGIVNNCGGDIRVLSEAGKGSEFQVYLPIIEQKDEPEKGRAPEPIRGGTKSMLVVDDEAAIRRMEGQVLETIRLSSDRADIEHRSP
jgi:hypothetical protein